MNKAKIQWPMTFVNNQVNCCQAELCPEQVQMLVEYEGQLVPIKEPIDLAERRSTPHPCMVIDLTEDDEETVPDSEGSVRDFMAEEKEQARNEEEETIQAKINWTAADPTPKYLPPYQNPPGIEDFFVSN